MAWAVWRDTRRRLDQGAGLRDRLCSLWACIAVMPASFYWYEITMLSRGTIFIWVAISITVAEACAYTLYGIGSPLPFHILVVVRFFSCLCRKIIHQLRDSSRSLNNKDLVFVEVARISVLALLVNKLAFVSRKAQHLKSVRYSGWKWACC